VKLIFDFEPGHNGLRLNFCDGRTYPRVRPSRLKHSGKIGKLKRLFKQKLYAFRMPLWDENSNPQITGILFAKT